MREYVSVTRTLLPILRHGRSLDASWDAHATPLAKQIAFGVLRHYFSLAAAVDQLVTRPLSEKHLDIRILLLAGIYSIDEIKRPAHASVNDAVESATALGKPWAKGMVNGVLRNYLRRRGAIRAAVAANRQARCNHPDWLRLQIEQAWPDHAADIMAANNTQAPMTLRVNSSRTTMIDYQHTLASNSIESRAGHLSPDALYLGVPVAIDRLPGFEEGHASVQDEASQLAAPLMELAPGLSVLDACAAPGGKTCHMLEKEPRILLTALDIDQDRTRQIRQNLARLGLACKVETADLLSWPASHTFDRILLDAPCSATGIIRRHPDIKLLRRESDIAKLVGAQIRLLQAAWRLLKPEGVLVYSTCSILPAENEKVVDHFLRDCQDAKPCPMDVDWGVSAGVGRQLFPVVDGPDGFFYARLGKRANAKMTSE